MPLILRPLTGKYRKLVFPLRDGTEMTQASFDFQPGLTVRFPKLRHLLNACVYNSRAGLNGVAADLDRSPSELSRMLSWEQDDPRKLDVDDFVGIIGSTADMRPVYWLMEKFMNDSERKRTHAIEQLAQLLPMLHELASQAGVATASARTKR